MPSLHVSHDDTVVSHTLQWGSVTYKRVQMTGHSRQLTYRGQARIIQIYLIIIIIVLIRNCSHMALTVCQALLIHRTLFHGIFDHYFVEPRLGMQL